MESVSERANVFVVENSPVRMRRMRKRIQEFDWSKTSLGAIEQWPQSLLTAVNLCLSSHFPMLILYSSALISIYNDAYQSLLNTDDYLGTPGLPVKMSRSENPTELESMFKYIFRTGKATWTENDLVLLDRKGYIEECYFSYSYTPILNEFGNVEGILIALNETTKQVVCERRLRCLSALATHTTEVNGVEEACRPAIETLNLIKSDIPYTLLYLVESETRQARLITSSGLDTQYIQDSLLVELAGDQQSVRAHSLMRVLQTVEVELIHDFVEQDHVLQTNCKFTKPLSAMALPVIHPGQKKPLALLVAGINPLQEFDDDYRCFLELVTEQIALTICRALSDMQKTQETEYQSRLDQAEQDLSQKAQEALQTRDELISIVSHDLKNPLTTIKGFAQLLRRHTLFTDPVNKEQMVDALTRIETTATRMNTLINELLDLTRLQMEQALDLDYTFIDLLELTSQAVSEYQRTTERHSISIETDEQEILGYWDGTRLERLIANLISNAIKFSPNGGKISIKLMLEEREEIPWVTWTIQDQGVGIPVSELPSIFDRFHKKGLAPKSIRGAGIGLASARQIVEQHAGTISVASEESRGTTFFVRLPLMLPEKMANCS